MPMTPQQKAEELSKRYCKPVHGTGDCEYEAYTAALEMSVFKDAELEKYLQSQRQILKDTIDAFDRYHKPTRKIKKLLETLEIEIETIDSIILDLHNGRI